MDDLKMVVDCDITDLENMGEGQAVRIGGLLQSFKEHKSRKGDRMAFTVFEDMSGKVEVVVFPSTFANCSEVLTGDEPLVVLGTVQQSERGAKLIAESVDTLVDAMKKYTEAVSITLQAAQTSRQHMQEVKEQLYKYHGATPIQLTLHFDGRGEVDIEVLRDLTVQPCSDFFNEIKEICGPSSLRIQMKKPEVRRRNGNGRNGYQNGKNGAQA